MARIAIDLSHEQREWNGYFASLNHVLRTMPQHTFETIEPGRTLDAATLAAYDALILALPCNVELRNDEIHAVRAWITENKKGLCLLSSYSGDAHHRTNLNELARPLGVEFVEDLVMPHDQITNSDGHAQVFDRGGDGKYVVRVKPPGGAVGAHPLASEIRELGFLSACSLKPLSRAALQFVLMSPDDSAILEPYMPIRNSKGWIMKIDWARSGYKSVPLLVAWQADFGKVVACGSWKLWLPELLARQKVDNVLLAQNIVNWLTA